MIAPLAVFGARLDGRRLMAPADGYQHYLPLHILAARTWRAGGVPVWNPYGFSGYPLMAVNQAAVFYPPNLLFLWLTPAVANNAVVVINFLVAGLGAFLLARRLCDDDMGAVTAGLSFGLCGFMFAHIGHQSMIASISWMPWALYGYELVLERLTPGRLLVAGGALAMSVIAGHGQMFFLVLGVLGLYATALTALQWREVRIRPLVLAALVGLAGAGLGAVQLFPTAAILQATARSRLGYDEATTYSMPLSHLPLLTFPYLFGLGHPSAPFSAIYRGTWNLTELSGYPGNAALVLAAAGLGAARRDRRVLALLFVGGVTFVIALGSSTPAGPFVHRIPVYGQFRAWARYLAAVDLVVALLAAHGVARLRAGAAGVRPAAIAAALSICGLAAALALGVDRIPAFQQFAVSGTPRQLALLLPTLAALAAATVCVLARWSPRTAAGVVAAVVALDAVVCFGWFGEWRSSSPGRARMRTEMSARTVPGSGPVPDAAGGIDRYLFVGGDVGALPQYVDVTDVKGLLSANGFDPLSPRDYLEALDMTYFGVVTRPQRLWAPDSAILDLLRVSVVLDDTVSVHPSGPPGAALGTGQPLPGTKLVRYERAPALPDAFLVGEVRHLPRPDVLAAIDGRRPFRPAATALVEKRCGRCEGMTAPGPAGQASASWLDTSQVRVDVRADRQAMLVVSQAWYPGWRASVDGHASPVVRVDGLVQGVPVPAGHHRVALRYVAPGLAAGAAVSVLSLAGLAGAAAVGRARRRRPEPAPVPVPVPVA